MQENIKKFAPFFKFLVIGGVGLAINLIAAYVLTEFFGFWYFAAFLLGMLLNWTFNFLANSRVTFRGHSKDNYFKKYTVFLAIYGGAFLLNSSLVYILTSIFSMYYIFSIVLATAVTSIITFSMSKKIVFQ